jgi:hypothetical protein
LRCVLITMHPVDTGQIWEDKWRHWVHSPKTEYVQGFISFGRGQPMLHGETPEVSAVDLCDPTTVLTIALRLMHHNHSGPDAHEPPLEDLVQTVQKLLELTTWSHKY